MTNAKMIRLIKRWQQIERAAANIDVARSQWSAEARAEFQDGSRGDDEFTKWVVEALSVTPFTAREQLLRALAWNAVGANQEGWIAIGGFRAVRAVEFLSRDAQSEVLRAASSSNKPIRTVMRERGHLPEIRKRTGPSDAEVLARFIADTVPRPPKHIAAIVARLIPEHASRKLKAA